MEGGVQEKSDSSITVVSVSSIVLDHYQSLNRFQRHILQFLVQVS